MNNTTRPTDIECARLLIETLPITMRALSQDARAMPGGHGTMPQYRILGFLHHHGSVSMGKLAEWHSVTLPTMTKIIGGLVDRGLVERWPDERDRRVVVLRLTDEGQTMFADLKAHMETRLAALMARMSDEEKDALAVGLQALRRVVTQPAQAEPTPAADVRV